MTSFFKKRRFFIGIGATEWLLIIVAVVLLFGAKRIPELARSLGRASYEFKKAKEDLSRESEELVKAAEAKAAAEDKTEKSDKSA